MKYSDEARFLLERINAVDAAKADATQLVGIQKGLVELVCRMAEDFDRMTDKLTELEGVADTLSEDLFTLQLKRGSGTAHEEQAPSDLSAYLTAEDDGDGDFDNYIHCPYCNTLIFVTDPEQEKIKCPFCNETFDRGDVNL